MENEETQDMNENDDNQSVGTNESTDDEKEFTEEMKNSKPYTKQIQFESFSFYCNTKSFKNHKKIYQQKLKEKQKMKQEKLKQANIKKNKQNKQMQSPNRASWKG